MSFHSTALRVDAAPGPDGWDILRAVRDARQVLGLRSGHVQTLQAMLSFLRPGQGRVVFASNIELCRRAGGIDERTLRRHIARLETVGILVRKDSPNGKRYRVRGSSGDSLSFGLSLEPLFARADDLTALALAVEEERRECRFLRKRLLARLALHEDTNGETDETQAIRKQLRRRLTSGDYDMMLAALPETPSEIAKPDDLPANDGQTVRHLSKSVEETQDKTAEGSLPSPQTIRQICTQAMEFAMEKVESWADLLRIAHRLAPMLGISETHLTAAVQTRGAEQTALTVCLLTQMAKSIRNLPAYFQSVMLGQRAQSFDPVKVLDRLARAA